MRNKIPKCTKSITWSVCCLLEREINPKRKKVMHFYYIIFSCIEARQVFHPSSFTIFPDYCHCTYWTSCYDICVDIIIIVSKTTGWTKDNFSWIKINITVSHESDLRYQVYARILYKDRMPRPRCKLNFLIIFWPVNGYRDYCACVSGLAENLSADTDKQA